MRRSIPVVSALCVLALWPERGLGADAAPHAQVLNDLGSAEAIVVLLGDRNCELAKAIAKRPGFTAFVQLRDDKDVLAARQAADAAGLYGTRVYVEKGEPTRIPLADNTADVVIAAGDRAVPPEPEVLRVLRPGGKALLRGRELTKPFPKGMADWSHPYHGPDNNPQSEDTLARAPYLTQFIAEPRYAACPQAAVAARGRLFMAFGHVAWHRREEPSLNTLIAMNGFNGSVLWRRPLKSGIMVDRNTMIATPDTLYLADDASCKRIDPATGKVVDEITVPDGLTDGTFWKWMALEDGVLYALVGRPEPPDPVARWRRTAHGWPWGGISKGYNRGPYAWGFAKTLLAIDPRTKKVLWHHKEEPPIDSRAVCTKNGRIYLGSFGKYLACLDARTGEQVWRRTAEKDADLFKAVGPYRPGHGYIGGWKSTVYLKCTDQALYVVGPQVKWLTALSAKDGSVLWKYPRQDLHVVVRQDGLYIIGPQRSRGHTKKLDPLTGKVLATYDISRRACTRSTGSPDSLLFRASGGTVRLDLASGKPEFLAPMRPSCHVGVVIANGHLYWLPWVCDCNLQMFGVIACAPAGGFAFEQKAAGADRLHTPAGPAKVAPFEQSPADWAAYRADNTRSATSSVAVPGRVKLLWRHPPRRNVEPTAPVAAGGRVFLGGSDGIVRALDAATGKEQWRAYTGGAVRYPPAVADGRALVGSGDGWAYAFEAATGRLLWRFRAAPAERRIRVYRSLLSIWPVAGGVLVDKGTAYFAAGMNHFDGTHVYAVDAATGTLRWQNNRSGRLEGGAGHGVGVQGDLLLHDGRLYLAAGNGASVGVYDAASGKCLSRAPGRASLPRRGRELSLSGQRVVVSGQPFYSRPSSPVYHRGVAWGPAEVVTANARLSVARPPGGKGSALVARGRAKGPPLWTHPLPAPPVRWGLAVDAKGRVIVTLRNGDVLCLGRAPG